MAALHFRTGGKTVTIETTDSLPEFSPYLVIRIGGKNKYISLVSTTNANASKIRIRINKTVYALATQSAGSTSAEPLPSTSEYALLNDLDMKYVFAEQGGTPTAFSPSDINYIFE